MYQFLAMTAQIVIILYSHDLQYSCEIVYYTIATTIAGLTD